MFFVFFHVICILSSIACTPIDRSRVPQIQKSAQVIAKIISNNENNEISFVDNRLKTQHVNVSRILASSEAQDDQDGQQNPDNDAEWTTSTAPPPSRRGTQVFVPNRMLDLFFAVCIHSHYSLVVNKRSIFTKVK